MLNLLPNTLLCFYEKNTLCASPEEARMSYFEFTPSLQTSLGTRSWVFRHYTSSITRYLHSWLIAGLFRVFLLPGAALRSYTWFPYVFTFYFVFHLLRDVCMLCWVFYMFVSFFAYCRLCYSE